MWKYLNKVLSLIVMIRHPKVPIAYKYYIRDTYRCQLTQMSCFVKDHLIKRPYKNISFNGEFGAELLFVLPFIYWHHKNGTLKRIASVKDTKCLYFFTPSHTEQFQGRMPEGNFNFDLPRILYSHNYNIKKWLPVPLKEHYANSVYVFEKPILIIANRYNSEWDGSPISYFSIDLLDTMINKLKEHYYIIYNRPRSKHIVEDNSVIYDLGDYEWLAEKHPDVATMEKLYGENKVNASSFNEFQLYVYANAGHFVSIHGGTATLASCFKGTNIIFSKEGPEHYFSCFNTLFPKLSGATIFHARLESELLGFVESKLLPEEAIKWHCSE